MRVVIAGGHGQIALRLARLLTQRGDQRLVFRRPPVGRYQRAGAFGRGCQLSSGKLGGMRLFRAEGDPGETFNFLNSRKPRPSGRRDGTQQLSQIRPHLEHRLHLVTRNSQLRELVDDETSMNIRREDDVSQRRERCPQDSRDIQDT